MPLTRLGPGQRNKGLCGLAWIESNKGNPIKSSVLKCVRYREFETADLIGFPLLDYIQSNHVSPGPLVPRDPGIRETSGSVDEKGGKIICL